MPILIRRSNLVVPITDAAAVSEAWRHDADAITLDLEQMPRADACRLVPKAIAAAARGSAEVFIRVNKARCQDHLRASVWPGLAGVVLPQIEAAAEVSAAGDMLAALERERGIAAGSLSFIVLLESPAAIWHVRSIVTASPRISQVALDEREVARALDIAPQAGCDPFVYARGRLVIEAIAAKVSPIGMAYPLNPKPHEMSASEIYTWVTTAKNIGMKGIICPYASWIEPVNAAFTPAAGLVAYNKRVREAFAAGVAAGTAAVPLEGRMIDVPVDEWAKVVLETAEACAARDATKRTARAAERR